MYEIGNLVTELCNKHGRKRESLMPILQGVVEKHNYLSDEAIVNIAKELDLSSADVYGTASFYSFLDTEKRGKFVIRVCKSIIAEMKGKHQILRTIEKSLGIKLGETTSDGMFTLLETNDIGWSDHEPSMLINEKPYTDLTPKKTVEILSQYMEQN